MDDKRIGTWATETERTIWPQETLSGRRITRWPQSSYRNIGNGQFVVIDTPRVPGFDYDAAMTEFVNPPRKGKKATSDESAE